MAQNGDASTQTFPLTPIEENAALSQQLQTYLQKRLPEYMVPSVFVLIDALPLTSSGKLDYRALPVPEQDRSNVQAGFIAPRTSLEKVIADIWANILVLKQVGVEDNFFQIGGHSLLVTQVIARIRDALHMELPLRLFFETPTITGLATYIETFRWMTQDTSFSSDISYHEREEGAI